MIKTNPFCYISALKVGYVVEDILHNSDSNLKIHSIFEHAVNLVDNNDWIITLLPESYCGGPQVLILSIGDFARFKGMGFKVTDKCDINQLINMKDAQITYKKTINGSVRNDIIKIEDNKRHFQGLLCEKGNKNGLLGEDNIYSRYAAPKLEEFRIFFRQRKFEEAGEKLLDLIGLGPGLTPSGDDFVLGIFAALYSFDINKDIILPLKDIITQKAKNKTNIISYNMLRQGAAGGFIEWVEDMAYSIIYESPHQIEKAFSNMQKIGSSSGSDISAGILFGQDAVMHGAI